MKTNDNKFISKTHMMNNPDFYKQEIQKGKIFIFPTDTIYGLGCNATNDESVKKIRKIKKRDKKPFSIIPPNYNWISDNCEINNIFEENYQTAINGKITLITNLKNKKAISKNTLNQKKIFIRKKTKNSIGIRISPHQGFTKFIQLSQMPFIATSVNISGETHIRRIEEIDPKIINSVDYIVSDGTLNNKPSTIIDTTTQEEKILRN